MSWVDIVGYAAALAVLCSFSMGAIVPLRILAIMSNVLFALYGVLADLYPVFFLHSILLPINLFKLARIRTSAGRHRDIEYLRMMGWLRATCSAVTRPTGFR
jgi:hypothetical protein